MTTYKRTRKKAQRGFNPIWWAAAALVAVSATLNAAFGYAWGNVNYQGVMIDGLMLAIAAIAADLIKSQCLPQILDATRDREILRWCAAMVMLIVTTIYSIMAALGFSANLREAKSAPRADIIARVTDARADRVRLLEDIKMMKSNRRYRSSAGCSNATVLKSRVFCGDLNIAGKKLDRVNRVLRSNPHIRVADPQSALLKDEFGVPEHRVEFFLTGLLAALVELGSVLGFVLARPTSGPVSPTSGTVSQFPNSETGTDRELRKLKTLVGVDDDPVIQELSKGGPAQSQDELAKRLGVSKGQCSKLIAETEETHPGLVSISRNGRQNTVKLSA